MATTALRPAVPAVRSGLYDWLTTTDHKKIGIMYVVNSFIFFFLGGILALGVRSELAAPGIQFFKEAQYNQLFTMHASFMLFLFVIPMLAGFGNYVVPLQIGAPDMAFPRINALSLWMLPLGGILMGAGFLTSGGAAAAPIFTRTIVSAKAAEGSVARKRRSASPKRPDWWVSHRFSRRGRGGAKAPFGFT